MNFPNHTFRRIYRSIATHAAAMSWPFAIGVTLFHALSTAFGLIALDEADLVSGAVQFVYFYVVTGSSVGYGDFSPTTEAGRLFAAIWIIPGAISLFAFMVGKIIAAVSQNLRKTMNGLASFENKTGHIVVLGHVGGQTERLLEETERLRGTRDMIIVSTEDISGQQNGWDWVRAASLSSEPDLKRAGILGAEFIVVLGRSDDESLTACLAVGALAPRAHCVAYFRDQAPAKLVRAHCPNVEIVTSTSVEQVARALVDPGTSEVLHRLVNIDMDATLHSIVLRGAAEITIAQLMMKMLERYGATLVGYRSGRGSDLVLSLGAQTSLTEGQIVYYIAERRIEENAEIAA